LFTYCHILAFHLGVSDKESNNCVQIWCGRFVRVRFHASPICNHKKACSHECTNGLLHVALCLPQIMSEFYLRDSHWFSPSQFLGKLNKLQKTPLSMFIFLCTHSLFTPFLILLFITARNCQFLSVWLDKVFFLFTSSAQKRSKLRIFWTRFENIVLRKVHPLKRLCCQENCELDRIDQ
jgi:hypothetical protein